MAKKSAKRNRNRKRSEQQKVDRFIRWVTVCGVVGLVSIGCAIFYLLRHRPTVIINRTNTGEAYKLTLAYHGVTNCDLNGYSVSADYNIANQLISIGVYDISADSGQVIIDLPSSLYSKLKDGTIKGFGLLNNGTYFKDVYCDGTCTLNVTYT